MKKILCLMILVLSCFTKSFALDVSFETQIFDGTKYLIMITNSDDDKMVAFPMIIKFYLNDGSVYRIETSESIEFGKSTNWSGFTNSNTSKHYYRFEVTPEMMSAFEKGIKGFVINTLPEIFQEKYSPSQYSKFMSKLKNPKETDVINF